MAYPLQELVDVGTLQALADGLFAITGITSAILAPNGEVLTRSGTSRDGADLTGTQAEPVVVGGEVTASIVAGAGLDASPHQSDEQFRATRLFLARLVRMMAEAGLAQVQEKRRPRALAQSEEALPEAARVAMADALRSSEQRLRAIIEHEPACVKLIDRNGVLLDMNPAGLAMIQATSQQVIGKHAVGLVADEDKTAFKEMIDAVFRGETRRLEFDMIGLAGRRLTLETISVPLEDPVRPGQVNTLLGLTRDITEQKRAEVVREQALSLLRATLESTADGILVVDTQGRIESINERFMKMWRIPPEVVNSGDDSQALAYVLDQLADPAAFMSKVEELYAHPEEQSFDVLEFKDGRYFERFSTAQILDGRPVGRVWSFRDVTSRRLEEAERHRLHDQLLQAQKRESVGRLAGGVAHDFNNQLSVILGNTELAQLRLGDDSVVSSELNEVRGAAMRSAALTRQLLAFARKQVIDPKVTDLNHAIADLLKMIGRLISEDVRLEWKPAGGLWMVNADATQIDQIMANLAVNAGDAMRESGGTLEISTANVTVSKAFASRIPDATAGDYVRVRVRDTGCGMTPETLAHVFEPFFTTKPTGRGTGLGMSMVHGIVHQHEGFIDIQSFVGSGTTVDLFFPRTVETVPSLQEIVDPATPAGRGEVVLVVEDEPSVRGLVVSTLGRLGYVVHEASDGAAALAFDAGHGGKIDLVISDVIMPGISGKDLVTRLRTRDPHRKYLFMSGYEDTVLAERGVLPEGVHFIQKPFAISDLATKVRKLLDERKE